MKRVHGKQNRPPLWLGIRATACDHLARQSRCLKLTGANRDGAQLTGPIQLELFEMWQALNQAVICSAALMHKRRNKAGLRGAGIELGYAKNHAEYRFSSFEEVAKWRKEEKPGLPASCCAPARLSDSESYSESICCFWVPENLSGRVLTGEKDRWGECRDGASPVAVFYLSVHPWRLLGCFGTTREGGGRG